MSSLPYTSGSVPSDSGGTALRIVEALKQYNTPLPVEFVGKLVDLPSSHIHQVIEQLQMQDIVSVDSQDCVFLTGKTPRTTGFFRFLTK